MAFHVGTDEPFEAPAAAVAEFVRRTYELVPAGQEGDFVDIESELDNLL